MLIESIFRSDQERREIFPVDMSGFPCHCRRNKLDWYPDKAIPWHWHNAFEITYVVEGALAYRTPEQTVTVRRGEALFTNSGVLHACTTEGAESCVYYTHFFDMSFLSGMYNSVFEEKYFLPVVRNTAFQLWLVKPDTLAHIRMLESVLRCVELHRTEPPEYEFDLRTELCGFWREMLADSAEVRANTPPRSNADTERIKAMMDYIQANCAERLTLDDIAASASISRRECTRCFRRCIDSTPNEYLTACRVRMAADLLRRTGKSILDISEDCGFSSAGYFGKVFREAMGCTPKEYRKKNGWWPDFTIILLAFPIIPRFFHISAVYFGSIVLFLVLKSLLFFRFPCYHIARNQEKNERSDPR